MQIIVNGESQTIPDGATVADLVDQLQLTPARVAVELNAELVRRATYAGVVLNAGDQVEIVTLVGGG